MIMDRESFGDRDSSVGIATRYGVEGPGSNTSLAEIFRTRSDWPRDTFGTMGTVSFQGVKRPGRGVDHPDLGPRLRRAYSYTSIPPSSLLGLLQGKFYLYLYKDSFTLCDLYKVCFLILKTIETK
jgi:hypothetical protein